jgi:hypothetical protein
VIADAAFEFRADRRRAVNDCKRSYPEAFAARVGHDRALRDYSGRWITGTGTKPFGFEWCCISLDLEPERVRQGIFDPKRGNGDTRRNSVKTWEEKGIR